LFSLNILLHYIPSIAGESWFVCNSYPAGEPTDRDRPWWYHLSIHHHLRMTATSYRGEIPPSADIWHPSFD